MDQSVIELITKSEWPVAATMLGLYVFRSLKPQFQDRLRAMNAVKLPGAEATFAQEVAQQESSAIVSPVSASPTSVVPQLAPEQQQTLVALATGWRYERAWRVLHLSQIQMLLGHRDGKPFSEDDARRYYNTVPKQARATWLFPAWLGFLIDAELIAKYPTSSGTALALTQRGIDFLNFMDLVQHGTPWPGLPPAVQQPARRQSLSSQ
jgi:hypothetical protein